jgi:tetratricopeptide (TPR) repeat protein
MQRGNEYFANGDYIHANVEFRNAMQIAPKDAQPRLMAARSAERLGQIRAAVGLYQSVADSTPDNVEAKISLARLLVLGGLLDESMKIVAPVLLAHPDDAAALTVRATARLRQDDIEAAEADAKHALRSAPLDENALALVAGIYQRQGKPEQAIELLTAALQKLPKSIELRDVLISVYASTGQAQLLRYRRALAVLYVDANRLDDAQALLEDGVRAMPNSNEAKVLLADFTFAQRDAEQRQALLQQYIKREPKNYELRLALADLLVNTGATQQGRRMYEDVAKLDPDGPNALTAGDRLAGLDFAEGHYDEASRRVAQILKKNVRDDAALALRARIELAHGDARGSIADLRAVLRDQPTSIDLLQALARAHLAVGEVALAEEALRSALKVESSNLSVRVELARVLSQSGQSGKAIEFLQETVRIDPASSLPREALVRIYIAQRKFAEAATEAGALMKLNPNLPVAEYLAGLAANGLGQADVAHAHFENALRLQPNSTEALAALVQVDVNRHQAHTAITRLQALGNTQPRNAFVFNLLGETYLAEKDNSNAAAAFQHASELLPGWWVPYHNLAQTSLASGDAAGAIAAYQAGLKQSPTAVTLPTELARLYEQQGQIDAAVACYDQWLARNPEISAAANNLAMLLATHKTDRPSLDRARDLTASFATSNDGTLLDTNGWVHYKRAEYQEAVAVLQRAVQRAPESKEIRYHLGMAELEAGSHERARADLEAAVDGVGSTSWSGAARTALASLKSRAG